MLPQGLAHASQSYLEPASSGSIPEDTILRQIGAVHSAMMSTDTTVMKEALQDSQRLISSLHRDLANVRAQLAEAKARLVNVAALKKGSRLKKIADKDHGGTNALLVPDAAVTLASLLEEEAKRLALHSIYFHSLYNSDYLFGSLVDSEWDWQDTAERFKDDESRKMGDIAEFFSIAPPAVHSYILTKQAPLPDQFRDQCNQIRSNTASRLCSNADKILENFRDDIQRSVEEAERSNGKPSTFQVGGNTVKVHFGTALFARKVAPSAIRVSIPEILRLLGHKPEALGDAQYESRWRPCLYKNRITEPAKEFTNPALLLAAEIMIFGAKSIEAAKPFLRSNNPLKSVADQLEVTPGLIATSAIWVVYILSGDREFTSDGKGAVTGIKYKEDFLAYREYLYKSWNEPWMKRLVQLWNTRLFPLKGKDAGGEDLSQQVENTAAWDDTDAMLARAREAAAEWSGNEGSDNGDSGDWGEREDDNNSNFDDMYVTEALSNGNLPNPLANPLPELQALELEDSNDPPSIVIMEPTHPRLAAPPVLGISSQRASSVRPSAQGVANTSNLSTIAAQVVSPLLAAAAAVVVQPLQASLSGPAALTGATNSDQTPPATAYFDEPVVAPPRRPTRSTTQSSNITETQVNLDAVVETPIVEKLPKKGRGAKAGTGSGKRRKM
ncbi:hypothetical protein MD484_g6520, partial [Candolleomyces efflorescens]